MDLIRIVLGIAAAVVHGTAFCLYVRQMKTNLSHPNIATFGISMFLMLLNALTFREVSHGWVATLQLFTGFGGCALILAYAMVRGKFSKPGPAEAWAFVLGVAASILWYRYRQATGANMIVLAALTIALSPTWLATYRNPFVDIPRSWFLWSTAYGITAINVLISPDSGWIALVNPIVSVIAHGLVGILSTESRKKKFATR